MATKIILPFRGEYGLKILYHISAVHAIEGPKVVCCEPGEAMLYPSADDIIEVDRNDDDARRDSYAKDKKFVDDIKVKLSLDTRFFGTDFEFVETDQSMARKYFAPKSGLPNGVVAVSDVVICPRFRDYGPGKNWAHWSSLARLLLNNGLSVSAIGASDSSHFVRVAGVHSYIAEAKATAFAIEAIKKTRLVIATDAGLAFLALLMGKPLLLIVYRDGEDSLTAPGPVVLGDHTIAKDKYPPVREDRYAMINHRRAPYVFSDSWHSPTPAAALAFNFLADIEAGKL